MSYTGTPTLYGEQQIAAAYQSGQRLPIVSIAVGDGNGAAVSPTEGMTALVNEVWRGAITSWGVDPVDPRRVVVHTTIPATAGPFTVREGAIFDSAGGMVAITALAATEIVAPGTSNQATALDLTIALPIGSAGAITVSPGQGERVLTERLIRTPFISINSASTQGPPASPAVGDLYIVPQGATGAWATMPVGSITEWNGTFWATIAPPLKMVAGVMDTPDDGGAEYLKWNGIAWEVLATPGSIFTVTDNGSSTPDEFVGTVAPALTALQTNMVFLFRQGASANQGVNPKANLINAAGTALGDVPFAKADGSKLADGDLPAKAVFMAEWDGALLRVLGQRPSDLASAVSTNAPPLIAQSNTGKGLWARSAAGTYTFTVPAGIYWVFGTVVGAGGGGSGGSTTTNGGSTSGAGGGAGGSSQGWIAVTPGQTITVVIGAGGAGAAYQVTAANGGSSSIGSVMSATGGNGGNGNPPAGGAGGTGSGGQTNYSGGNGGDGSSSAGNAVGGQGGSSLLGGGGRSSSFSNSSANGRAPGSGGGGVYSTGGGGNGGTGADGYVSFQF